MRSSKPELAVFLLEKSTYVWKFFQTLQMQIVQTWHNFRIGIHSFFQQPQQWANTIQLVLMLLLRKTDCCVKHANKFLHKINQKSLLDFWRIFLFYMNFYNLCKFMQLIKLYLGDHLKIVNLSRKFSYHNTW